MPDNSPTSTHAPKGSSEPPTVTAVPPAELGRGTQAQEHAPTHLFTPDALPAVPGYVVTRELGRGGMSIVYAAHDPVFDREVAVKVMLPGHDDARFVVESKVTAQLSHPNIPPVYALGTLPDGRPFLAMKLIQGRTLADEVRQIERVRPADVFESMVQPADAYSRSLSRVLGIFEQICQTMSFVHSRGIIHRDLKPSNVMIGAFGEVQVMDWGLAKEVRSAEVEGRIEATTLNRRGVAETVAGQVKGTASYMAPEQARGEPVDARADVFALGGILAEVLTGKPPFVGDTVLSTVLKAAEADLHDCYIALANCAADAELVNLARKCLSANAADRFPTAKEVADAIGAYRLGIETRLRQINQDQAVSEAETRERKKRRKVQSALLGAILCLGVAVSGLVVLKVAHTNAREAAEKRERETRNSDAVATALERGERALQRGDADDATAALEEFEPRLTEGGTEEFAPRIARYRKDLAMLKELDRIDNYRWLPSEWKSSLPTPPGWKVTFAGFGLTPELPSREAAQLVNASLIRDRLLGGLDLWLVENGIDRFDRFGERGAIRDAEREKKAENDPALLDAVWLTAVLKASDPSDYRDGIRAGLRDRKGREVWERLRAGWLPEQPRRFVIAMCPITNQFFKADLLRKVVLTNPSDLAVLMSLAQLYSDPVQRVYWYRAAVAAHPRHFVARFNLSLALQDCSHTLVWDEAIDSFHETIKLNPTFAPAHYLAGRYYARYKGWTEAIRSYDEAIRLDPRFARAYHARGLAKRERDKGDLESAIEDFRKATQHDEKFAEAYYDLFKALIEVDGRKQQHQNATEITDVFNRAIKHNPTDSEARGKFSFFLQTNGRPSEAVRLWKQAYKHDQSTANLGHWIDAINMLDRIEASQHGWIVAINNGDLNEIRNIFQEYGFQEPDPYRSWGELLVRRGRIEEALGAYRKAVQNAEWDKSLSGDRLAGLKRELAEVEATKIAPLPHAKEP